VSACIRRLERRGELTMRSQRMTRAIGFAVAALLFAAPGFAQKISIDYASEFDFDAVATFQYVDSPESTTQVNQLMADRVVRLIREELTKGGLREVEDDPDIYVTYHYIGEEKKRLSTTSTGYGGYGGYWGGWDAWGPGDPFGGPMMGTSTTREYSYEEGTLVIDAYDSAEKKLVWRGSGTVVVKDSPQKQVKQVEKILRKMGKRWDRILANIRK
jgi:hypothetical protein